MNFHYGRNERTRTIDPGHASTVLRALAIFRSQKEPGSMAWKALDFPALIGDVGGYHLGGRKATHSTKLERSTRIETIFSLRQQFLCSFLTPG